MKIAICDDILYFAEELKEKIEQYYRSIDLLIYIYQNPVELLQDITKEKNRYQAIFLDIEMPKMNGMTLAKKMRDMGIESPIIFLTSHEEHMEEGYEVSAFRFLVKPVSQLKLEKVLEALLTKTFQSRQLAITCNGKNYILYEKDILYIKAENVYLKIFTKGEGYLIREKLNTLEKQLNPHYFIRIHRSYMINLSSVISYDKKKVDLGNGVEIPISRSCYDTFQCAFMNYIKEELR